MGHRVLRREEEPNVQIDQLRKRIEVLERRIFNNELPWMFATNGGIQQTVTTTTELLYEDASTNRPDIFDWDDTDPAGMLVKKNAIYLGVTSVRYLSGSIAVPRAIYQAVCQLSQGPLFCVGAEWAENAFNLGTGQRASSIAEVTSGAGAIAKSVLAHIGIAGISANIFGPDDPARHVVFLQHAGVDYTVGNLPSATWLFQLATYEDIVFL